MDLPRLWPLYLFVAFAALGFAILQSALGGPFVSDDRLYLINNPYISPLSLENVPQALRAIGAAVIRNVHRLQKSDREPSPPWRIDRRS